MKNIISLLLFLTSLFSQYQIEGRWHLVGYEDNVMYQFEDNYRYSIYSVDGVFGSIDDAGGTPNPYIIEDDVITINLFFGNIVSYTMDYKCNGQVVDFIYIPEEIIHSTLFKEGFNYTENNCEDIYEELGDFNFDGYTNVVDVIILVNHILNPATIELQGSDINNDGNVNVSDVIVLINIILN